MKSIYIILMQTGTIPSSLVSFFTRFKYSHVALSFDRDCSTIYSFGRRNVNSFLNGGFVVNHKKGEFFKKFNDTECIIYELKISNDKYYHLKKIIRDKEINYKIYRYDYFGVILRYFYIPITFKNKYVCSYFVASVLDESDISLFNKKSCFVKPEDFSNISSLEEIYRGKYLLYK